MSNIKNNIYLYDENDRPHGEWVEYHRYGELWYRENWVHGIRHGLDERYYSNGQLRYRGYWNMDRRIGYWCWLKQKKYYLCLI